MWVVKEYRPPKASAKDFDGVQADARTHFDKRHTVSRCFLLVNAWHNLCTWMNDRFSVTAQKGFISIAEIHAQMKIAIKTQMHHATRNSIVSSTDSFD